MADRPDDLRGWQLLAQHEAALGNFAAAKTAQTRVLALKGDATTPADRLAWVDRAVAAAGGEVSPETEAQLRLILETTPQSYGARYYTGLLYAQTDRADIAFRFWRPLVEDAPQTPHTDLARAQIEDAAYLAGIDYTVPPANMLDSATLEAAEEMAPEDRAEMIQGMVAGLADRLANEGGGPQDWARLIRAYGVLGDTAAASEVWNEAQSTFAANLEAMTTLRAAAQSAGVLE
jgi:cytochrome c-type biogenesis protein CcmH